MKNHQQMLENFKKGLAEIRSDWKELLDKKDQASDPDFLKKVATDIQNLDRDAIRVESIEPFKTQAELVHFLLSTPWGAPFVDETTLLEAAQAFHDKHLQSELNRLLSRFAEYGHQMETPIFQVFDEIAEEIEHTEKANLLTSKKTVLQQLANAVMHQDQEQTAQCFSKNASIFSPRYGTSKVNSYFSQLFKELKSCKIKMIDFFSSANHPMQMIALCNVSFNMYHGDQGETSLFNLLTFEKESLLIRSLQLVYTAPRGSQDCHF